MLSFVMMILWTLRTLFAWRRRFDGPLANWFLGACFSLLFGIVYAGMGWMKKGPVRRGHRIAGMIAAYLCLMGTCWDFLPWEFLKASDGACLFQMKKKPMSSQGREEPGRCLRMTALKLI